MSSHLTIPRGLVPHFQEYDTQRLSIRRDANLIIQRTLEFGTWDEVRWLYHAVGERRVRVFVRERGERLLSPVVFNYWRKLLQIQRWRRSPFAIAKGQLWQR